MGNTITLKKSISFSGGSVAIRRDCIKEVGFFDEDFIMFFEDVDYSIRCKKKVGKSIMRRRAWSTINSMAPLLPL